MSACPSAREQHLARLRWIAGPRHDTVKVNFSIDVSNLYRHLEQSSGVLTVLHRYVVAKRRTDEQLALALIRWGRRWGIVPTPIEQMRRHIENVRAGR